jgi:hypothetical protein
MLDGSRRRGIAAGAPVLHARDRRTAGRGRQMLERIGGRDEPCDRSKFPRMHYACPFIVPPVHGWLGFCHLSVPRAYLAIWVSTEYELPIFRYRRL